MVCTSNICRSPMAAELLGERLDARLGACVVSAGIAAVVDQPADPFAVEIMTECGIDTAAHRARQLDHAALVGHGLVVARGRAFLLGHWRGREQVIDPYGRERPLFEHGPNPNLCGRLARKGSNRIIITLVSPEIIWKHGFRGGLSLNRLEGNR